jgi:hypothetical protein
VKEIDCKIANDKADDLDNIRIRRRIWTDSVTSSVWASILTRSLSSNPFVRNFWLKLRSRNLLVNSIYLEALVSLSALISRVCGHLR